MPQVNPRPDPLPSPPGSLRTRFWRIFRILALLSVVVAGLAVALVARGDPTIHIHMLIATALGVGFTMLLGTALMTLAFLSSSSGHDDAAAPNLNEGKDEQ